MIGVNEVTVRSYEREMYKPKTETLYKLANALGCNINDILDQPFDLPNTGSADTGNSDAFLLYLESLGYTLSFLSPTEMAALNVSPENDDDYYVRLQSKEHTGAFSFHRKEFLDFQRKVEEIIEYELYKQSRKI